MIRIDFESFEDLALDRLENFWDADEFETEVFKNYLEGFDGCDVNLKQLVDNFHINNFSEIEKEELKKFEDEGYFTYSNEEEARYAVVY